MYATVIPFFLAANITAQGTSEWTFGPEYTYIVMVNQSILIDSSIPPIHQDNVITHVKCQLKDEDTLHCLLVNTSTNIFGNSTDRYREGYLRPFSVRDTSFEMKFDEIGVKSVTMPMLVSSDSMNMIKLIVMQFSMGTNVERILATPNGERKWTIMGMCDIPPRRVVNLRRIRQLPTNVPASEIDEHIKLIPLSVPKNTRDEDMEIWTKVDVKTCNDHVTYSPLIAEHTYPKHNVDMVVREITIRPDGFFRSSTIVDVNYAHYAKRRRGPISEESISIYLQKIAKAENPPASLQDGQTLDIISDRKLNTKPKEHI